MTLQEILNEAQRLTLSDQIYLATRLLEWVEQQVQPGKLEMASPSEVTYSERGTIAYLMANPLPVFNFKPLDREEIYDRS
jgi:hypothetical protein